MRLDVYLCEYGYVASRQKAKGLIEDGNVSIDGKNPKKPSYDVVATVEHKIEILNNCPYVSRGGLKLEKILNTLKCDLHGKVAIDIGASTGGFTDCLLQNSVSRVYAIDSGTNQLHKSLLNDPRVVSKEKLNARELTVDLIGELADVITCDVSFISQAYIIPVAVKLLKENGIYIGLIKPQFEVGKSKIGKNGIVKEQKYRKEAVEKIYNCARQNDLNCISFCKSPIFGGDGNIEYLVVFSKNGNNLTIEHIKKIMDYKED